MQHYHLISSGLVSSPVYQLFPPFRSRVSLLFPPDFFFLLFSHPFSSILIYFYFPFHIIQFASSHPHPQFDFFVLKSCLFVHCRFGSRFFSSSWLYILFHFFTPSLLFFFSLFHSIHRHHLISTLHVCIRFFLYHNPHSHRYLIPSRLHDVHSILSHLEEVSLKPSRNRPPFSLFDQSRESFIHFWHRRKRNRDRIPGVDYECHFYMTLFSYFSVFPSSFSEWYAFGPCLPCK